MNNLIATITTIKKEVPVTTENHVRKLCTKTIIKLYSPTKDMPANATIMNTKGNSIRVHQVVQVQKYWDF
jgi:hypothetical protein